jgi:hypothetical protein
MRPAGIAPPIELKPSQQTRANRQMGRPVHAISFGIQGLSPIAWRERGLAKAGNARVRRAMIQLAWGHLLHQKDSVLTAWYRQRTADARGGLRKTMIVALARKLLIVLWRMATTGVAPAGIAIRPAV